MCTQEPSTNVRPVFEKWDKKVRGESNLPSSIHLLQVLSDFLLPLPPTHINRAFALIRQLAIFPLRERFTQKHLPYSLGEKRFTPAAIEASIKFLCDF
jgi:hypothetical protein